MLAYRSTLNIKMRVLIEMNQMVCTLLLGKRSERFQQQGGIIFSLAKISGSGTLLIFLCKLASCHKTSIDDYAKDGGEELFTTMHCGAAASLLLFRRAGWGSGAGWSLGVAFRWAEACGFAGAVGIVTLISIILIYSSFMLL